jgi:endonuclease/exonuclease/phosphatase (EEP) superfamily protein YafD
MSIELSDFTNLVDDTAVTELAAKAEAITEAVRRVEEQHPGFSYTYHTEIRCDAWECSQFMELTLPKGVSTYKAADKAYAAHRAERVDALLAEWFPAPENLGN